MKCKKHPKYQAIRTPTASCLMCKCIFRLTQIRKMRKSIKQILKHQKTLFAITRIKNKKETMTKTKTYTLVSPQGKKYKTSNLTQFANRFRNLTRSGLSKVVHGRQSHHKNWTIG